MFDIARRDEKGLLIYDDDFRRRFMTPKEIAASDKWVKKHGDLIRARDEGKITKVDYERFCDELDAAHDEELSRIYDEDFGNKPEKIDDENSFSQLIFANA